MNKETKEAWAIVLYHSFDFSFNRDWGDLPKYVQEHWLEQVEPFTSELLELGLVILKNLQCR